MQFGMKKDLLVFIQKWSIIKVYGIKSCSCSFFDGMFYDGLFEETIVKLDLETQEGFVIRFADQFAESEMNVKMGKFVR